MEVFSVGKLNEPPIESSADYKRFYLRNVLL